MNGGNFAWPVGFSVLGVVAMANGVVDQSMTALIAGFVITVGAASAGVFMRFSMAANKAQKDQLQNQLDIVVVWYKDQFKQSQESWWKREQELQKELKDMQVRLSDAEASEAVWKIRCETKVDRQSISESTGFPKSPKPSEQT